VVAHDEIVPGNVLRPDNARKFTSFYFSFAEFGHHAVRNELCWFHVGVLRTKKLDDIPGGLSTAVRFLLRALLLGPRGFTSGVVLPLDEGPTMLFAKLNTHLGDEAALSYGLSTKTAAGIRPCLKCANVVKKGSDLATRRDSLVEITCTQPERFVKNEDEHVWAASDRLVALQGTVSQAELDRRQKAAGLTLNSHGVLSDMELRAHFKPVSSLTYDWQHTFLSNGVASQEVHCFLKACERAGIRDIWQLLGTFCAADWSFPKQHGNQALHQIFNKAREKASSDHWKSGASELLSVYPLIRRFAESIVLNRCPSLRASVQSLVLCFKVLDLLQDAKGGDCDTANLQRAIQLHLQQHIRTYGEDLFKPKGHYALHIPDQIRRDGMLFDCFVVERAHQLAKLMAGPVQYTASFEKSVIAKTLLSRLRSLETFDERNGLRGKQEGFPELQIALGKDNLQIAASAKVDGLHIAPGDILFVGGIAISLKAVVSDGHSLGVLGQVCNLIRSESPSAKKIACRTIYPFYGWASTAFEGSMLGPTFGLETYLHSFLIWEEGGKPAVV